MEKSRKRDAEEELDKRVKRKKQKPEVKELSKEVKVPPHKDRKPAKPALKESSSSEGSSSDETPVPPNVGKSNAKVVKRGRSNDEDSSSDEEPSKKKQKVPTPVSKLSAKVVEKHNSSDEEDNEDSSSEESSGSKTLFVGNLSYDAGIELVEKFFEKAGQIVDVRLATAANGRFKGFGHVEFATEEAAQRALKMNSQKLLFRPLRIELARERGSFKPNSGKVQSRTTFVNGFDRSLGDDKIRRALEKHFGSCGEITRVSILKEKGIAYIDFNDEDGPKKAIQLNGSDLRGYTLTVDIASPKVKSRGGGRGGSSDGGGRSRCPVRSKRYERGGFKNGRGHGRFFGSKGSWRGAD